MALSRKVWRIRWWEYPEGGGAEMREVVASDEAAASLVMGLLADDGIDATMTEGDELHTAQMDAEDAAEALGCSVQRVGQLCRAGSLRAARVGGRWLIDADSVYARRQSKPRPGRPHVL